MADVNKFSFDKLNKFNWQIWKFRMEMLLTREELWYVVDEEKPKVVTDKWKKDDSIARSTIGLCINDAQLSIVRNAKSAKGCWDMLRERYEKNTVTSRVSLLKKLCGLNLAEGADLESHLMVLDDLFDRLMYAGQELEEPLRIAMILRSLPDSYNGLVTALEGRPDADITMELVKSKLLDEFEKRKERCEENFDMKAMKSAVEQSVSYFDGGASGGAAGRVCYFCNKPGHVRRYCRSYLAAKQELEQELFEKKKKDEQVCAKEEAKQVKDERYGASVCFLAGADQRMCWYIDSGASRHMTSDRNFFESLKKVNGPSVMLANGKVVTATGCGDGVVNGVDANGNDVKVRLTDVLYVPSLASGLVSVDKLTSKEFSVNFKKDGCDICDKAGKKMVVGEKCGPLYRLKLAKGVKKEGNCLQGVQQQNREVEGRASVGEVSWYMEIKPSKAGQREDEKEYFDVLSSSEEEDPEEYLSVTSEDESKEKWREVRRSRRSNRGVRPSRLADYVVDI